MSEINNSLITFIKKIIDEYEDEWIRTEQRGFKLFELSYAKFFQKREGGCNEGNKNKQCFETIYNLKNIIGYENYKGCEFNYRIINYKSINNNCGLVCLINALNLKANVYKPDSIRKEYGIELYSMMTKTCRNYFLRNPIRMGGNGIICHVDESCFSHKRKAHRGRPSVPPIWVFRIVDTSVEPLLVTWK